MGTNKQTHEKWADATNQWMIATIIIGMVVLSLEKMVFDAPSLVEGVTLAIAFFIFILPLCNTSQVGSLDMNSASSRSGKVLVFQSGMHARYAEIKGIKYLQPGVEKSVKIRFYRADGEGDWEVGDGYQTRVVERRAGGIYLV